MVFAEAKPIFSVEDLWTSKINSNSKDNLLWRGNEGKNIERNHSYSELKR